MRCKHSDTPKSGTALSQPIPRASYGTRTPADDSVVSWYGNPRKAEFRLPGSVDRIQQSSLTKAPTFRTLQ